MPRPTWVHTARSVPVVVVVGSLWMLPCTSTAAMPWAARASRHFESAWDPALCNHKLPLASHSSWLAITFTVQAQETLLKLPWPERLLQDDFCRNVTAGDVWNDPRVAGQGSLVMSGLRVRMGINTGALGSCKGVQLLVLKDGLGSWGAGAAAVCNWCPINSCALAHTFTSRAPCNGHCGFFTYVPAERLGSA